MRASDSSVRTPLTASMTFLSGSMMGSSISSRSAQRSERNVALCP